MKESKVIPLTTEQVLQASNIKFNYIAMDGNNEWNLFTTKPVNNDSFCKDEWLLVEEFEPVNCFLSIKSDKPWRESLIYRGDL